MAIDKKNTPTIDILASHIIFISDIHFGVHSNSEEWQENQRRYFKNFFMPHIKAIKEQIGPEGKLVCMCLGDTFTDRQSTDINVENLAFDVFEEITEEVEMYILNGNHDLSKKTNMGNTSLRGLDYIEGVHVLTQPTLLKVYYMGKTLNMIAIPYLGDFVKETEYLASFSSDADYALMHTEISKMKMDNGMTITNGANPEMFKGMILSGHIHRRQETKKVIYLGNPYQTSRGDIGDVKGLYTLDVKDNALAFIENDYSPIYNSLTMEEFDALSDEDKKKTLTNNYTTIVIDDNDVAKYQKKYDLHNLGDGLGVETKSVQLREVKRKHDIVVEEHNEMSIAEQLNDSIRQMDLDDETKERLYMLSNVYLKDAEAQIVND